MILIGSVCFAQLAFAAEGEEEPLRSSILKYLVLVMDRDGDGLRDLIEDPDDDNDGVLDEFDDLPFDPTESVDTDGDGIGNNADTDDDNDGVPDGSDPFPLDPGPVADAGPDQSVQEEIVVNLTGSGSTDPGGAIASYQWSQDSGTAVTINNATASMASFTAPSLVTTPETLVFRLSVTDAVGQASEDTVTVEVNPNLYNVAGIVTAAAGTAVDADVNDTFANYADNDSIAQAQPVMNPLALGGYVNVAGSGADGRSKTDGDVSDYFSVNLQAGQQIALVIADSASADLDLYLYDAAGAQIDASAGVGAVESLTAPSDGAYYVEVSAFSGASSYQLFIGQTQGAGLAGGFRLSDDFVPGEMVVRYRDESLASVSMASARTTAASKGLQIAAGAPGRSMLARIDQASPAAQARAQRQVAGRSVAFADDTQRLKYETLIALKSLSRDPSVAYAHPNYIVRPTATPNDPYYPLQWHLDQIAAPTAWDITTGDPGVT
ncbi:MAG: hypothetical protein GWM88_02480, partial [Pseudomonadales bacterium]|nr:hypothetical protein [Pseudomonadales bacterium]NIX06942.1 hypothetical protein [Pseudomonadales bacterium]